MSADESKVYDLIIIGAGLYGIQAGRTYLEVYPTHNVVILESTASPGGVWSSERMYDDFWTQTPLGIAGFSDRPLERVPQGDQYYGFFAAEHITHYIEEYLDSHNYAGSSLRSRIYFKSTVESLEKSDGQWLVKVHERRDRFVSSKIIDASGLTSIPNIPSIPGLKDFEGKVLHHKQFGSSDILSNSKIDNITVVGGAKSAADIAYAAAKAGKNVTWIIRKSGSGPAAFFSVKGPGPYRNSNESFYTRITGYFIASIFASCPWWLVWLYTTALGTFVLEQFWNAVDRKCRKLANYDRHDGQANGFYNLKPDTPVFWQNDSSSVNQRSDFFDVIASKVKVYREDVISMESTDQMLVLSNEQRVPVDALVFATGWKNEHPYFTTATKEELGLPFDARTAAEDTKSARARLEVQKEQQVLHELPILSRRPQGYRSGEGNLRSTESLMPYRLYRSMVPISDRSIIFLGHIMLGNHFRASEVQALWAIAYLGGSISIPSADSMREDVAKTIAWCRCRYLQKGQSGNWFYYDLLPYTDMLLRDIGLKSHLRSGWRRFFAPAWASDLENLIQEYKLKYQVAS